MSAYEVLGVIVYGLCTLSIGIVCLWRPTAVRDYALRTSAKWNPFRGFMESKSYIWSIRSCGVIAMLMFLLALAGFIWRRE